MTARMDPGWQPQLSVRVEAVANTEYILVQILPNSASFHEYIIL